jgi:hypothetical protein
LDDLERGNVEVQENLTNLEEASLAKSNLIDVVRAEEGWEGEQEVGVTTFIQHFEALERAQGGFVSVHVGALIMLDARKIVKPFY